jgi:hypothetical protein
MRLHGSKSTCVLYIYIYIAVCMATKTYLRYQALSVSEKLEVIKMVDAQLVI